jgi:hypothetical protein
MPHSYPNSAADQRQTMRSQFYRELPYLLAPAFPGIDPAQLEELARAAWRYFKFSLFIDDLLDGDIVLGPSNRHDFLAALTQHEQSLKGLATLFPIHHAFWGHFEKCRLAFDQAQRDVSLQELGGWTSETFEAFAVAKSAMTEVVAYALHGLSKASNNTRAVNVDHSLSAVLDFLRWYHIASQIEDDVIDFKDDWERNQPTFTHFQVLNYLQLAGICQEGLTGERLRTYLYTSGIAAQLLSRAEHYYRRVGTQAQLLGLTTLATLSIQQLNSTIEWKRQIQQQISAATSRATQANLQQQAAAA